MSAHDSSGNAVPETATRQIEHERLLIQLKRQADYARRMLASWIFGFTWLTAFAVLSIPYLLVPPVYSLLPPGWKWQVGLFCVALGLAILARYVVDKWIHGQVAKYENSGKSRIQDGDAVWQIMTHQIPEEKLQKMPALGCLTFGGTKFSESARTEMETADWINWLGHRMQFLESLTVDNDSKRGAKITSFMIPIVAFVMVFVVLDIVKLTHPFLMQIVLLIFLSGNFIRNNVWRYLLPEEVIRRLRA
ncbi:MAG: hypothetical protein H7A35_07240 [Planctomycetales bacterium]|nr:hypothetical protein [bacterium]UNM09847.1 MAG: hypothetical protein H7A35_07240 [Planctomycetales bacterium]